MLHKFEIDNIKAELGAIHNFIQEAERYSDFVGKMQFEYRKSLLESELEELQTKYQTETKASVALFFGGNPVVGSMGICADFAGAALNDFQNIISKVFAKSELGHLGERGIIPFASNSQLMVTSVVKGSFGFVLDEMDVVPLSESIKVDTKLKDIIDKVSLMIERIANSDQQEFEEILLEIDDRILKSLQSFFANLERNKATIRLVEGNRDFLLDKRAIKNARSKVENNKIDESTQEFTGMLGILPESKKFELKTDDDLILGNITKDAIEQYSKLVDAGNILTDKLCTIAVAVRSVTHSASRKENKRYTLLKFV